MDFLMDNIVLIYFLVAFLIMIGCLCWRTYLLNKGKKDCTYKVQATVVKMIYTFKDDQPGAHVHDGDVRYGHFPCYRYTYNGKDYEVTARIYKRLSGVKVGDVVTLYINPNNPYQFHADNEKYFFAKSILIILLILFALIFIPYLIFNSISK